MTEATMGYTWKGAADLERSLIPLTQVQPHPKNVRKGNVDVLARSMQKFGQMSPILAQKSTGYIIKGNHTWKAAKLLGWDRIACNVEDCSDDIAYAYLLADNRASDLADYDKEALARNLTELADAGKLGNTLWTADDLDDIQAAIGTIETLAQEFKGDYSDDPVTREQRLQRELTRVAPKMREIPVVVTVEQHAVFMSNLKVLQAEYRTGGAIETILVAVQREADRVRGSEPPAAPQPREAPPPDTTPAAPPAPAPQPPSASVGQDEAPPTVAPGVEPESMLSWAKSSIWKHTANICWQTFNAMKQETFSPTIVRGIVSSVNPVGKNLHPQLQERRRAVQHILEAIEQSPLREFSKPAIARLLNRVADAGIEVAEDGDDE